MSDKCEGFVARWDHAMCSRCGEEHDRPAHTPTPAPGLDLDAVERDVAHLDGPHSLFDDRTLGRVLAVCNAAPALIAEVRALRRHYDAAGPDHNLLALLDLYHEREQAALAKLAETTSLLRSAGDLFVEIQATDGEDEHKAITDGAKLSAAIAAALEAP